MRAFHITYATVTQESCEQGEHAFNGYLTRNGEAPRKANYCPKNPARFTLREAVELLRDKWGGFEPIESHAGLFAGSGEALSLSDQSERLSPFSPLPDVTTFNLWLPEGTSQATLNRIKKLIEQ